MYLAANMKKAQGEIVAIAFSSAPFQLYEMCLIAVSFVFPIDEQNKMPIASRKFERIRKQGLIFLFTNLFLKRTLPKCCSSVYPSKGYLIHLIASCVCFFNNVI